MQALVYRVTKHTIPAGYPFMKKNPAALHMRRIRTLFMCSEKTEDCGLFRQA